MRAVGRVADDRHGRPDANDAPEPCLDQRAPKDCLGPWRRLELRRVERPSEALLGIHVELDHCAGRQLARLRDARTISRLTALVDGEDRDRRHDEQTDERDGHQRQRTTVTAAGALDAPFRLVPLAPREDGVAENVVEDLMWNAVAAVSARRDRPQDPLLDEPRHDRAQLCRVDIGVTRESRRRRARSSLPTA